MPDWKPILIAPVLAVFSWMVAYGVAGSHGAPRGDTNFTWMPFLPLMVGFWWMLGAGAILLARAVIKSSNPDRFLAVAALATAANLIAVALIYLPTIQTIGDDEGWPSNPVAVGALLGAAIVSLLPVAWLWRSRRVVTPPRADLRIARSAARSNS